MECEMESASWTKQSHEYLMCVGEPLASWALREIIVSDRDCSSEPRVTPPVQ